MIDAIRARHVRVPGGGNTPSEVDYCDLDFTSWPCDTATVLAALDEETANRKKQRVTHATTRVRLRAAEAREAALRAALRGHHENGVCSIADPAAPAEPDAPADPYLWESGT